MNVIWRGMIGAGMAGAMLAGLSGCQSAKHEPRDPKTMTTTSGHGDAPALATVQVTSSNNYNYVMTVRREAEGGQAFPSAKQMLDLGHGGGVGSVSRLNLEKGFVVVNGCFPTAPMPPGNPGTLLPRPWPVVTVAHAAVGAEGTKFSVYMETYTNGTNKNQYVFVHEGGPVRAWIYTPGTDPTQSTATVYSISYSPTAPQYLLISPDGSGGWMISVKALPTDPMDLSVERRYFNVCNAVQIVKPCP
ncbi:MAG: hypothetical protein KGS45_07095 [Planctomycetes bacterium]|nr:hypothetical protein [Planctomycetota bacterium]